MGRFVKDFWVVILICQVLALVAAWNDPWYFKFLPFMLIGGLWILQWVFIILAVWAIVLFGRYAKRRKGVSSTSTVD